jgi:DNA-binding Lrp family transcriptional regulator
MNQEDIKAILLERAYDSYFHGRGAVNLNTLNDELRVDQTVFWNIVHQMSQQGLIRAYAMGGNYKIQSYGIVKAEEQNIVAEKIKNENQHIRTRVLEKLAKVYKTSGADADAYIEFMAQEFAFDIYALANNLQVLEELGYIEAIANGSYKLTLRGLDAIHERREIAGFAREYEQISTLTPQPRGRALQDLLAKVIEKHGWSQEQDGRASQGEIDVVIHKAREYFLTESKWEKDPIETPIVRELHGKLSYRIGVQGIIVSMSGFTGGAVAQAEDYASSRIILFFGKRDIEQIIFQQVSLDALLDEKYQQLITWRKVIYH